ncbi:MAG TPA: hypothetical protein VKN76_00650 [Kiloniellaceae bacterium]|nr:hypothetical protein [Kiloniellaceae bacterium]
MNATAIRGTMLGLGLAGALCLVSGKVAAQDCDLATVAGSYGMNFDGFLAEENPSGQTKIFLNKRERGVGRLDLYDDGTLEVSIRGFTAGLPANKVTGPFDVTFEGTWSVEADCTGDMDLAETGGQVDWLFVAMEDAESLFILSGASMGQAEARRIASDDF